LPPFEIRIDNQFENIGRLCRLRQLNASPLFGDIADTQLITESGLLKMTLPKVSISRRGCLRLSNMAAILSCVLIDKLQLLR